MWHEQHPNRSVHHLRRSQSAETRAWNEVEEAWAEQRVLSGLVEDFNRGGLLVALGQVRGFLPASQLSSASQAKMDWEDQSAERFAALVGLALRVRVVDVDRSRNRLILSEWEAQDTIRPGPEDHLWHGLTEGDVQTGAVTGLAPFGAIVDLGGTKGLIHVSELSWSKVSHPAEILQVGDEVRVKVLWKDQERQRVALSLRQLQPNPWETLMQNHRPGDLVWCQITRIEEYGAFAQLQTHPVEGLIHISELSQDDIEFPEDMVVVGDEVQVRILSLDPERRRLGLSLKQADPAWRRPAVTVLQEDNVGPAENTEWQTAEDLLATQAIVSGDVVGYNQGGLLVGIGSMQGFIPASHLGVANQMLLEQTSSLEDRFALMVGKTVKAKVIDQEPRHNQLILSEKAAERAERSQDLAHVLENLEIGAELEGIVASLTGFGAIVNVGDIDGLIHVSELSWSMVNHPSEILSVGERVRVKIIWVDKEQQRIGLSLRQLRPNPWETLPQRYQEGDLAWATITRVEKWGAFARLEEEEVVGLIHISEMSPDPVHAVEEFVTVDEEVEVRIISLEPEQRRMGLSLKQVHMEWEPGSASVTATPPSPRAVAASPQPADTTDALPLGPEELQARKQVVACTVVNANRGGVLAVLGQYRGFIPTSHLSLGSLKRMANTTDPTKRFDPMLGETLPVLVIDMDNTTRQLILSEKEALRAEDPRDKEMILSALEVGEIREGVVSSVAQFGVFVNIGELDGLIHISELSWSIVDHPSEILNVGDLIQVKIIVVDQERQHIGLSLRQLHPNPWDTAVGKYREGDIVRATVVQATAWGALVQLPDQQGKGRIYLSEMSDERTEQVHQAYKVGEVVEAKIVSLDLTNPGYPLILSEKKALRSRYHQRGNEVMAELAIGDVCEAVVTRLVRYGAFVDIEGAAGLIHISELSWSKVNHPSNVLHVGDPVKVKVISLDQERQHIGLSLRQMLPNPWEKLVGRYPVGNWVDVTVTRFIPQGALAQLANESVEGLIYHNEVHVAGATKVDEVVAIGERHRARILFVDPERRRIGLSLKEENPEEGTETSEAQDSSYNPVSSWDSRQDVDG